MLNFVKMAFRGLCEISLWLLVIVCIIVGFKIGSGYDGDNAVTGGIIGLVIGLVISILSGGFIATFLEMGNDLTIIKAAIAKNNMPNPLNPSSSVDTASASSLVLMDSGKTLCGVISREDKCNLFRVILAQPGRLSIKVTTDDEDGLPHWDSFVNVLDATGKKINTSGRFEFPYNAVVDLPNAGTYVIEITSLKTGRYYLTVQY
jgi:hypothetical protein